MKHKLTLYQTILNGGDGSAHAVLVESEELAEWSQDHQNEGWGETCTETIQLESDSPITVIDHIQTKEEFLEEMFDDYADRDLVDEFIEKFFPNGLPENLQERLDTYEKD